MALEDTACPTKMPHPLRYSFKEFAADMLESFNPKRPHPLEPIVPLEPTATLPLEPIVRLAHEATLPLSETSEDLKENVSLNKPPIKKRRIRPHRLRGPRLRNSKCKMCNAKFTCKSLLRTHVSIRHFGIARFECDTCKKSFDYRNSLKQHLLRYPDKKCMGVKCNNCDETFRSDLELMNHARFHHKPHRCQLCNSQHDGLKKMKAHMISSHPWVTYFICPTCNTFFSTKRQRLAHQEYYQGLCNNKPEECDVTRDQTKDVPMSHTLMICHHFNFNIICDQCGIIFNTEYQLSTHAKHNHLAITCQICSFACPKGLSEMNAHFGDAHPGTPYFICLTCNSLFDTRELRNSHQEFYQGSCVFSCEVCDQKEGSNIKGVLNTEVLRLCACYNFAHAKPTISDQLLQCKMCEAKISGHYSDLQKHVLTAHDLQPCEACNKQFISQPMLDHHACPKRHQMLPLTCRKCSTLFEDLSSKQLHDIRYHVTPLQCIYCARFVADVDVLRAHYERFRDGACIDIKD